MEARIYIYSRVTNEISQRGFPTHPEHLDAEVFTHYEYLESQRRPVARDRLNVVVFNMMRGAHLEEILRRIQATPELRDLDVLLASELDIGMCRSGNHHIHRELARALGLNCAFGVEFVELSLGDEQERRLAGENLIGLHGNAVFSRFPLEEICLIRLPKRYDWYHDAQKRIGSRIAVAARLSGTPLTVVSVHLENFTTPEGRRLQTDSMLKAIAGSALIGGDFNTLELGDADSGSTSAEVQPHFDPLDPVSTEPLFQALASQGFHYELANPLRIPTTPKGEKIDWVFIRDVEVVPGSPVVIPAICVDDPGRRISDHDFLKLTIVK